MRACFCIHYKCQTAEVLCVCAVLTVESGGGVVGVAGAITIRAHTCLAGSGAVMRVQNAHAHAKYARASAPSIHYTIHYRNDIMLVGCIIAPHNGASKHKLFAKLLQIGAVQL